MTDSLPQLEAQRSDLFRQLVSLGDFRRGSITPTSGLPEGALIDKTVANFTNGVLEVTVPIPVAKTARTEIPVVEESKKAA